MPEYLGYPISACLAIFPTALLMGLAFPIGLHTWASAVTTGWPCRGPIGQFYSLNVTGAIAGSLAAGFVLLPQLGSARLPDRARVGKFRVGSRAAVGLRTLRAPGARQRPPGGVRRVRPGAPSLTGSVRTIRRAAFPRHADHWQAEDLDSTVTVHSLGKHLMMTINGNHQAGTDYPAVSSHRQIGHLPMTLHPRAINALVIGLGGGATAGAVSVHDGVQVDVVELPDRVVRGARFFEAINYGVLSRPNVHLRVDDGRNYLMLTPRRYDVITADVTQPLFAGAGNLYSAEYFRLIRRVLNPGGLVMQWVFGTEAEYKTVARTFLSVFPGTTVWGDGCCWWDRLNRCGCGAATSTGNGAVRARAGAAGPWPRELSGSAGSSPPVRTNCARSHGAGPVLTDDRPLMEYFLSLPRDRTSICGR